MILYLLLIHFAYSQILNIQPLSVARQQIASTSLPQQGLVFFAGGDDNQGNLFNVVDIFNITSNSWSISYLSQAVTAAAATSLPNHGLAFFIGGCSQYSPCSPCSQLFSIYNAITNTWNNLPYIPNGICAPGVSSLPLQGLVFAGGGSDNNDNFLQSVLIYNANTNSVSYNYLSSPRYLLLATSLPNFGIVVFAGGYDINFNPSNIVDVFNYTSNTWSVLNMSLPRVYFAISNNFEFIFFAGGFINSITFTGSIDVYDIKCNCIYPYSVLSTPLYLFASTSINIFSFYAGGLNSNLPIDTVQIIPSNYQTKLQKPAYNLAGTSLENYGLAFFAGGLDNNNNPLAIVNVYSSCNAGLYFLFQLNACAQCPSGTYSNFGAYQCTNCPPGFFCSGNAVSAPIPSSPGCYIPGSGAEGDCVALCSLGYYCPSGSFTQTECPPGFFCDEIKMSSPKPCPSGTYNPYSGKTSINDCQICPPGTYCNQNISASSAIPCPAEFYCPAGTISLSTPCPPGYYCPFSAQNKLLCPPGSYCPISSSVPFPCPIGSYCPEGSNKGIPCKGGYQCPFGSIEAKICPKNTFSLFESGACTPCPNAEFTDKEGSISCKICPSQNWNIDGWYCMNDVDRAILVTTWLLTAFSSGFSIYKFLNFIIDRYKGLKSAGINMTLKNFIFVDFTFNTRRTAILQENNDELINMIIIENIKLDKIVQELKMSLEQQKK